MREIKFRAWIKKTGDMIFDVQNVQPVWGETFKDFLDSDYCEIMQYTGLKDKNGVEIYEGDIVSAGESFVFIVVWLEKATCFAAQLRKTGHQLPMYDFIAGSTVIGNIYENPELLDK